jgi:hypothetical protein
MIPATQSGPSRRASARLLVLCARPGLRDPDRSEVRALLRQEPLWEWLIPKADGEGVLPLLYWNLKEAAEEVPPSILERLKTGYLRSLARNLRIASELAPFLRAAREARRKVVLTKGLRLASTVYPDAGLRPFWDVDLVASPADWPALRAILDSQGFRETSGGTAPPTDRPASSHNWAYSPYFRRGDLFLEFHFNALGLHFPAPPAAEDGLSSIALAAVGAEATVFSAELELCYLCVHAQQHSYRRLIWLTDIAQMADAAAISWDKVAEISAAYKITAPVFYGLNLATRLWPGTVAPQVLAKPRPDAAARAALGFLWPARAVAGRELLSWPYYTPSLFSLWERRSVPLAIRSLRSIAFPPRPWLAHVANVPVDSAGLYFHYVRRLLRPFGLAARRLLDIR